MEVVWKEIVGRQFGAAIDMFEKALDACPEPLWTARMWNDASMKPEFSEFWYVAFHTLFWLDLYLSGAVEGFSPPAPFTLDELDPAGLLPEKSYTRAELQAYLAHCRQKCQVTVSEMTHDKAGQRCSFSWGQASFAELLLDNMRHVQEHGAQLRMFLGQQAGKPTDWQSRG